MTKVTRKAIISAISANDAIFNEVMAAVETDKETLKAVLDKWTVALNKTTTKKADEARETMINDIPLPQRRLMINSSTQSAQTRLRHCSVRRSKTA